MPKLFYFAVFLCASIGSSHLCAQQTDTRDDEITDGILEQQQKAERELVNNPFAITQHRLNYILPYTHVTNPNALGNQALTPTNVDNSEAKFQISIKTPLYRPSGNTDGVYMGFTLTSFWQLYNSEVSKPFRETNYEPEVFWQQSTDYSFLGYEFNTFQLGINHMSNGQSGERSRSWNRLFASMLFSENDNLYYVKAWYRIPEDAKTSVNDVSGDDNPDISDFYGRMELGYGRRFGDLKLLALLRNNLNFNNNRGSLTLNVFYPINDRYELLIQYFNGYGDSLIDYNRSQERIGIGFKLKFI